MPKFMILFVREVPHKRTVKNKFFPTNKINSYNILCIKDNKGWW